MGEARTAARKGWSLFSGHIRIPVNSSPGMVVGGSETALFALFWCKFENGPQAPA